MIYLSGALQPGLDPRIGLMITPFNRHTVYPGRLWAADTGCFTQPERHDNDRYLAWLARRSSIFGRCLFATAPDVVGDAARTLDRGVPVLADIRALGIRAALVGQDGMTPDIVPWDALDALFIGGTTAWKVGEQAAALSRHALALGKWLHMGRVNSRGRMRYARDLGCHSVDGNHFARNPSKVRHVIEWIDDPQLPLLPVS